MARWHHWLDGCESQWTPGFGDGQGGLACCESWGCKESETTEWLNWTELKYFKKQIFHKYHQLITWVWAISESWWLAWKPGVLQSMGSQSRTHISYWTDWLQRAVYRRAECSVWHFQFLRELIFTHVMFNLAYFPSVLVIFLVDSLMNLYKPSVVARIFNIRFPLQR